MNLADFERARICLYADSYRQRLTDSDPHSWIRVTKYNELQRLAGVCARTRTAQRTSRLAMSYGPARGTTRHALRVPGPRPPGCLRLGRSTVAAALWPQLRRTASAHRRGGARRRNGSEGGGAARRRRQWRRQQPRQYLRCDGMTQAAVPATVVAAARQWPSRPRPAPQQHAQAPQSAVLVQSERIRDRAVILR